MSEVKNRLEKLRAAMKTEGADWYLITSDDYHTSEYIADYFNERLYYTGFTGENAVLLLNKDKAHMWTDGRFFIQAARELEGSGIELMKMGEEGVPKLTEFIEANIKSGEKLYFDGRTISTALGKKIEQILDKNEASVISEKDIAGDLWTDRPSLPNGKIWALTEEEAGESVSSKLARVRVSMDAEKADALFLAKLDNIMWLTNLRGEDVEYNPVALSYMIVKKDEAVLFLLESETTKEVKDYCDLCGIKIMNYDSVLEVLKELKDIIVMAEEGAINYASFKAIEKNAKVLNRRNCTTLFKAVKNEKELERTREVTIEDSVCVTKFMYWLKKNIGKTDLTELSCAEYLDNLRRNVKDCFDLSFPTISAYGPNAAMMHYSATPESFSQVKPEGMLLVDSGGQYKRGTTDVTRTFILGPVSDEIKKHFTKVAAGMLALADCKFIYGCTGRNLDILARLPMWEMGIDYKCGTGHGVGYILNVHEGPQSIRWMYNPDVKEAVFEAGMIVSDEPGVYVEGSHGIRTENCIECVKREKTADGQFMGFEHLTFVPIDKDGIDIKYLSDKDRERLNNYHKAVYEKLAPFFDGEEKQWLLEMTEAI